ncbi:MAG: hypothetical protein VX498_12985, partial [Myxococcota bacterium]|nr:hypothetical protein [Myxococcota bacterium]
MTDMLLRPLVPLSILLCAGLLSACPEPVEPLLPDPCAWLEVSFQSDDEAALLEVAETLVLGIDPEDPFVDDSGTPFPEGEVADTGISFVDLDPSDPELEMAIVLPIGDEGLPTLALDLGANVPTVLRIRANAIDADELVVAESEFVEGFAIPRCGVFPVELGGLNREIEPPIPTCSDELDNDGDGWVDLADPGCDSDPENSEEDGLTSLECNDGQDNDDDGLTDSADPDCLDGFGDDEGESPVPECSDGEDNDGDGWVDLDDPGCSNNPEDDNESSFSSLACSDGEDNDGDGLVDAEDPDC